MTKKSKEASKGEANNRLIRPLELLPEQLCRRCDPENFGFQTTDELPVLQNVIGQPRALRALELGSEVAGPGYNIFVLGLPASGRTTLSLRYLQRKATNEPTPDDWCYVNNFENPRNPRALHLPAGRAIEFREDIKKLIGHCQHEIPRAFDSDEYTHARDQLVSDLKKNQDTEFTRLQEFVEKYKFIIARTPFGIVLTPGVQGKPLTAEEIESLNEEQRLKLEELKIKLSEEVEKSLECIREMSRSASERLNYLNRQTVLFHVKPLLDTLKAKYSDLPHVIHYLEQVEEDILRNPTNFHPRESAEQPLNPNEVDWTQRYEVNILIDHSSPGAPVIVETQPAYYDLLGRIEHIVVMGGTRTDFTMIQAGAFHRANGGYLILPARDLLVNPYAWEGVKRVLRDGVIRIIELGSQLGIISTETLEPEPIPLDVKVVLVGTPLLYYLLSAYDEDFRKLFKVRAEFTTIMERNSDTEYEYGLFVKSVVEDNHLPPFNCQAIARLIEFSSRLAEDQHKLSTRFGKISDLVRESAYWASQQANPNRHSNNHTQADGTPIIVDATAVQRAIDESIYRSNLIEERLHEMIAQDVLLISTTGRTIGQINALSVLFLGDYSFGRPSRVTATVFPGRGGIIDIERQARLAGPIHTKGVLILSGYLYGQYGRTQPVNLSASLTFEQSYDEVEGDSASAAELFALLSAIAGVALRQDLAITGSINQLGEIQAIGGINEKIEGFFNVCRTKSLTGEQGVLIPAANQPNLMLRREVIEAVAAGQFHIWPIVSLNEGLELLTGLPVGTQQADGSYPIGTFNHAVTKRLTEFNKIIETSGKENHPIPDSPPEENQELRTETSPEPGGEG